MGTRDFIKPAALAGALDGGLSRLSALAAPGRRGAIAAGEAGEG